MRLFEAVNMAKSALRGLEDYNAEAEWLVALTVGVPRSGVYGNAQLSAEKEEALRRAIEARVSGLPLAYIVGNAEFFGREFDVDECVLIPRPETEELVELALKSVKRGGKVLDVGTGSGAIAITIALESGAEVTAVDISGAALEVAKGNAKKLGAEVEFIASDMFAALEERRFDVIVSNPPYVTSGEYESLSTEVKCEPRLALVGGEDGLDFYRILAREAPKHLTRGGRLLLEIGYLQGEDVKALLQPDFEDIIIKKDLEGKDRMISARLKGEKDNV